MAAYPTPYNHTWLGYDRDYESEVTCDRCGDHITGETHEVTCGKITEAVCAKCCSTCDVCGEWLDDENLGAGDVMVYARCPVDERWHFCHAMCAGGYFIGHQIGEAGVFDVYDATREEIAAAVMQERKAA